MLHVRIVLGLPWRYHLTGLGYLAFNQIISVQSRVSLLFMTNKCNCGKLKDYKSLRCQECKNKDALVIQMNRPLKDCYIKGNARIKYAYIRKLAREFMMKSNIVKECKICKFDACVEVAHIKAITEFEETALIKDVNSFSNMVYLCPNHHTMLDKNLLSLVP